MKKLLILCLFVQVAFQLSAQDKSEMDYVYIEGQDTVYGFITDVSRSTGNVNRIEYYDLDKQQHVLKRSDVNDVKSLRVAGRTLDYIPLKASRPNSYHRHIERTIDGKIKIYDHIRLIASTDKKGERKLYSVVGQGASVYIIKLDNGKFYDISKGNIKKYVAPHMVRCADFKKGFKEPVTNRNIQEAVIFYNKACN